MCCDHRLMTPHGAMGLNEVVLGIPVPRYWAHIMARLIGPRQAEKLLFTGKMASPAEAHKLGLVDEVVDKDSLMPTAHALMQTLIRVPAFASSSTKLNTREEFIKQWLAYLGGEAEAGWSLLVKPETRALLASAMQRVSSKPPAKASRL